MTGAAAPSRSSARVAVVGDIGGQLDELRGELQRLGADPSTGRLPDELTVVQVGDLIHRGPDSEGVLALVDRYLTEQPGQWIQLVGNHEAQYISEPSFEWGEQISDDGAGMLLDWWSERRMRPAIALHADGADWLITHAGLTEGFWAGVLHSPATAREAASAINALSGLRQQVLFSSGQMLGGGPPNLSAGPIWAAEGAELIASWLAGGVPLPFSQIHGHSSVVNWRRSELECTLEVGAVVTVDPEAAHTIATLPGGHLVGVDPGHGRLPHRPWQSLVFEDALLLG
ncbi:calcineurin-like phosphoesterase family protein [Jatrophihabitans sp. GAS493]|uniref:metallophosphoesterase n=1 Tax=Jatrophihabitans sp. GAS493 TaxID=1907575 RepID=UPI000BB950E8|nr:metallophosphoesterase [Jatrophihabitans sp. GAS493]SOD70500.1 calcineurin-like phosphoesterase family protein [Jatrophihabitans sp. GAS493]